jgi:hypothetical protein
MGERLATLHCYEDAIRDHRRKKLTAKRMSCGVQPKLRPYDQLSKYGSHPISGQDFATIENVANLWFLLQKLQSDKRERKIIKASRG